MARSDILLPASHPRRLSRTIRTPIRTIFIGHLLPLDAIGMRIEQGRKSHVPCFPKADEFRKPWCLFRTARLVAELHHAANQGFAFHPERHPVDAANDMVVSQAEFHAG